MGAISSIPTDPSRKVQVIAAGYGRTGTVSTSLALARLLDGPVLHGGSQLLVRNDSYCKLWYRAYKAKEAGDKELTLKLVREATAGYVATADVPTVDFLPELMELYPNAKVILVRRDPEKWWNSVGALTSKPTPWWLDIAMAPIPGWRYIPSFMRIWSRTFLGLGGLYGDTATRAELIERGGPHLIVAHNRKVRSLVPKKQLLEMEIREGWKPLCRFLRVPIPDEPFPRANDAKAVEEHVSKVYVRVFQIWLGIFTTAGVAVYSGVWLWKNKAQALRYLKRYYAQLRRSIKPWKAAPSFESMKTILKPREAAKATTPFQSVSNMLNVWLD